MIRLIQRLWRGQASQTEAVWKGVLLVFAGIFAVLGILTQIPCSAMTKEGIVAAGALALAIVIALPGLWGLWIWRCAANPPARIPLKAARGIALLLWGCLLGMAVMGVYAIIEATARLEV